MYLIGTLKEFVYILLEDIGAITTPHGYFLIPVIYPQE